MKHKILYILSVIFLSSFIPPQPYAWRMDEVVYYSIGPDAYAYHVKRDCARIQECLKEGHVRSCTRKEAIEKHHRQPCGTCSKKEHSFWNEWGWLKH